MGTFNTQKLIYGDPSLIPVIASRIETSFTAEGYTVTNQSLMSGVSDISITKGGIFKAVLGMKTALKVTLRPQAGGIMFNAGIGIFGQQVIPTMIMMFVAWPVVLTQIWGLVQQSKLDDKALAIAEEVVHSATPSHGYSAPQSPRTSATGRRFCTGCGCEVPPDAAFCPNCGKKL